MPNPNYEMPSWEKEQSEEPPEFTKTRSVDNRTHEEFVADHELHKEVLETAKSFRENPETDTNFQKIVKEFPATVPESAMTDEEKDAEYGAHLLRKHDLDLPN